MSKIKKDHSIDGMSGKIITSNFIKKSIQELDDELDNVKTKVEGVSIDGGSARNQGLTIDKIDGGGANG